jgi:hypothetical protein
MEQIRLMLDPIGRIGWEVLLVTTTESGSGTEPEAI